MKTVFGCFLLSLLLSGCSVRHVDAPLQNTTTIADKQGLPDFALVHPLTDDPDNPSPNNPLIKKFGDIPEVHTYIRLQRKFLYGIGLNIDETIELYTVEAYLYPSLEANAKLKAWKKVQMSYNIKTDSSDDASTDTETMD